jgi:hypothetical protein
MIALNAPRIEAVDVAGRRVSFCSEVCRDEFADIAGLIERGEWHVGAAAGRLENTSS